MVSAIRFYRADGEYGFLSNFALYPITLDGKEWSTSEHYFQARKFLDEMLQEEIRSASTPGEAARLGRDRARPLRADWELVKDDVMYEVVLAKFSQHPDLRERLLSTGDAYLVEHTEKDGYWGDGGDGSGKNRLGSILMRVREELRRSWR
jgi:ribA/ribD-fused uncharacterized protein